MVKNLRVGRPTVVAPDGYLSMREVALRSGCSYSVVYRHVSTAAVRWQRGSSGAILVDERDLKLIRKHEPPKDRDRIPVQLAPSTARHQAWARAAHARDISVTELAYRALDKASGYRPES